MVGKVIQAILQCVVAHKKWKQIAKKYWSMTFNKKKYPAILWRATHVFTVLRAYAPARSVLSLFDISRSM